MFEQVSTDAAPTFQPVTFRQESQKQDLQVGEPELEKSKSHQEPETTQCELVEPKIKKAKTSVLKKTSGSRKKLVKELQATKPQQLETETTISKPELIPSKPKYVQNTKPEELRKETDYIQIVTSLANDFSGLESIEKAVRMAREFSNQQFDQKSGTQAATPAFPEQQRDIKPALPQQQQAKTSKVNPPTFFREKEIQVYVNPVTPMQTETFAKVVAMVDRRVQTQPQIVKKIDPPVPQTQQVQQQALQKVQIRPTSKLVSRFHNSRGQFITQLPPNSPIHSTAQRVTNCVNRSSLQQCSLSMNNSDKRKVKRDDQKPIVYNFSELPENDIKTKLLELDNAYQNSLKPKVDCGEQIRTTPQTRMRASSAIQIELAISALLK